MVETRRRVELSRSRAASSDHADGTDFRRRLLNRQRTDDQGTQSTIHDRRTTINEQRTTNNEPRTITVKGNLIIISSPSGGGKGTLIREVLGMAPHVGYSVSYTTRAPRFG